MAGGQLSTVIRHLRRVVHSAAAGGSTDAQLLERFVQGRDESAFELLVWRHGAMVLNVCRRVLRREQDAEDAFQATFLALVRKAGAIGKREAVSSWLCKVAYRIALRARRTAVPLPLPAEPLPDASAIDPVADLLWREWQAALDEEVHRLPDRYRVAFVLCHLEGQTIEAAARSLGCPPGTVGTRLTRARDLLRRRLARRGFDRSVLSGSRPVVAALPAALVDSTVQAALLGTADRAAAAGLISAHVAALTKGALRTMSLTKWVPTMAVVLILTVIGGGTAFLAHRARAVEPAAPRSVAAAWRPPARHKEAGVVLQWKFEKGESFYQEVTIETSQTMTVMNNVVRQKQEQTFHFRWTPLREEDGRWVLAQKIVGLRMDLDIGGSRMQFDSTKDANAPNNPLSDFCTAVVGSEFRVTVDREGKVRKVEGRDEILKKLAAVKPMLYTSLNQILSDDAVRTLAETSFAALRRGAVRPGDSWARKCTQDNSPLGEYHTRYKYTYEGRRGGLDRIKIESTLQYRPPAPLQSVGSAPFQIKKGDITGEGTGVLLFDRGQGRLVSLELTQERVGELTIEIGGQETHLRLSETQHTTIKTTDANPIKPARARDEHRTEIERLRGENERLREENERLRRQLQAVKEALRSDRKPNE